jgi:hypothetical protein
MIYGLSPFIQKKQIDAHCFGDCGKIQCAAVDCGDIGSFFICLHDDCPYEDKCTPVIGDIRGDPFKIRKLKESNQC